MATIKVMSAGAVKAVVTMMAPAFENASGHKLDMNFATAGATRERFEGGEKADVVILPDEMIAALDKLGRFAAGSVTPLGSTVTGVIVREGTPAPDISTPAAFVAALRSARSFAYTDPKSGGSGGIMFAGLLQRLGITDEINAKAVFCKGGHDVATTIAEGRAELATTLISEALSVKSVTVVGPLPGELHFINTYTAAIPAGSAVQDAALAFLRNLTAPATRTRWVTAGLEPAFPLGAAPCGPHGPCLTSV